MDDNKTKEQQEIAAANKLRERAEATVRKGDAGRTQLAPEEAQQTAHELLVHQAELEIQNEELRRVQLDLEEARDRYADLYDFAPVGYFTIGKNGLIEAANLTGAKLLETERGRLPGTPFSRYLSDEEAHQDTYYRHLREVIEQGRRSVCELRLRQGLQVRVESTPVLDAEGTPVALRSVLSDISDLKKADAERGVLQAQLRQSQKLEAMGTLAGGIAHDFNNILGAILGFTQLLIDRADKNSEDYEDLNEVLGAARRARELVKQILLFARKSKESRAPIHIHLVVEEAVNLLRHTLPSTIKIQLDVDHDTGLVLADATQLHQILMNLGTNAYHAMKETGGELEVRLNPIHVDPTTAVRHPDLRAGRFALLTVSDTGTGMDPGTMSRIFEPFFTTKVVGEGTGMGLSVVHGVIRSHGGAIGVESSLGAGTTFKVFLPLAQGNETQATAVAAPSPARDEHILLVDDEPALAKMLGKTLESLGYRATRVLSSQAALDTFRAEPEAFDLMLTDQTMPDMTGDQLAREVMRIRPGFPVIICTGYSDIIDDEKARAMGIRALLMKPVDRVQLAGTLRRVLDEAV